MSVLDDPRYEDVPPTPLVDAMTEDAESIVATMIHLAAEAFAEGTFVGPQTAIASAYCAGLEMGLRLAFVASPVGSALLRDLDVRYGTALGDTIAEQAVAIDVYRKAFERQVGK